MGTVVFLTENNFEGYIPLVKFYYQDTCPPDPGTGSIWYDSETGKVAFYFYDTVSEQNIWATPTQDCCPPSDLDVRVSMSVQPDCTNYPDWSLTLSANATGGTGAYSYDWYLSSGPFSDGEYMYSASGGTGSQTLELVHTDGVNTTYVTAGQSEVWSVKVTDAGGNISKSDFHVQTFECITSP